jgi:hypothetical protein
MVNTTAHTNTGRETMWFAWFMKLKSRTMSLLLPLFGKHLEKAEFLA